MSQINEPNHLTPHIPGGMMAADQGLLFKKYLNIHELEKYLQLSRWTIYKLIDQRKLPHIQLSKRTLRFDREKIDKWMEKREVKSKMDVIH